MIFIASRRAVLRSTSSARPPALTALLRCAAPPQPGSVPSTVPYSTQRNTSSCTSTARLRPFPEADSGLVALLQQLTVVAQKEPLQLAVQTQLSMVLQTSM